MIKNILRKFIAIFTPKSAKKENQLLAKSIDQRMHSEDIIVIDEVIKINEGNNPLDNNSTPLRSRNITGCLIFDINKMLQQKVLSPSPDYSFEKSAKSILKIDEKFKNEYKNFKKIYKRLNDKIIDLEREGEHQDEVFRLKLRCKEFKKRDIALKKIKEKIHHLKLKYLLAS